MGHPRYLILGTGALGTVFGGLLFRAGHSVALAGRGEHFQHLVTRGGLIEGIWGDFPLPPLPKAEAGQTFEVILCCVKSFDTAQAAAQARAFATPATVVVSLQNGLGNLEILAQTFGSHRTVGGRVIFGAQVLRPGLVRVTVYADKVLLGPLPPHPPPEILPRVVEDLEQAGIPTALVPDIQPPLWNKVLYNCALNALAALLEVPYGALAAHPETRAFMRHLIEEIYQVARAKGVVLPVPTPEAYLRHLLEDLVPPTAAHRPSMWQDLKAGRPTEIEALNGAICRYAGECGLEAPFNEAITRLIRFRHPAATPGAIGLRNQTKN